MVSQTEAFGVRLGEKLSQELLIQLGHKVVMSDDPYDMNKDMLVDGIATEIKSTIPYYAKGLLTISGTARNQLRKCLKVPRLLWLIFPGDPSKIYSKRILESYQFDYIELRESPRPGQREYTTFYTKANQKRIGFPISHTKLLTTCEDQDIIKYARKLSTSSWT